MSSEYRYELGSTKCPTCDKVLNTEQGVRMHHTRKHDERLPNRVCKECQSVFYDDRSDRLLCDSCSNGFRYSEKPDHVELDDDDSWEDLNPNERYYYRNKESERERISNNKERRVQWVRDEFLVDADCDKCGFSDARAIEFHHTDDNQLDESPLQMGRNLRSKEVISDEFSRGILLCANCHMIKHHPDRFG